MVSKSLISGSTTMLILKLLEDKDMYGYQMIEELHKQSNEVFKLKAGTLYPLLHGLENEGIVESYDYKADNARVRKYYHLTAKGKDMLYEKQVEWNSYVKAIKRVLKEDVCYATR